jgi:hypothetical protein
MVAFPTMITLLTKERGQQGNHGREGISSKHRKFGNLDNTGNHGCYMNAAKPGKQGNRDNFKINGNVTNESSYAFVKFFHVVPHV